MTYTPGLNGGRINATISGNTAGAAALVSTGTMTLAGGNNITLSQAGNAITISGGAGGAGFSAGMSTLGNTSNETGLATNRLVLAGGSNVTLEQYTSTNGNTIGIHAASQTVQTQNIINALSVSGIFTGGTLQTLTSGGVYLYASFVTQSNNSISLGLPSPYALSGGVSGGNTAGAGNVSVNKAIYFAGGNNITLSNSSSVDILLGQSQTVTISAANQTNQTVGIYAASNTTQSTSATVDARSMTFAGAGAASVGATNGSVVISVPSGGGAAFSAGMSNIGNTSGTSGTVSNQLVLAGGDNVTLSQSTAAGGNTITISAGGGGGMPTLSRFDYREGIFTSLGAIGQGSLSVNHMYVPFNVTGTAVKIGGSLSAATNTSATTASANISLWMGIYTLNGSTLSLASSGSANNGFQWSQSASTTANTSINSMRQMTVPMNINMTPGEYWMAAVISSATTYTSAAYTLYGNNLINAAATAAVLTPIGSGTTANRDAMLLQGIYTAATSAGPTSITGGQINASSASNVMRANFYNAIYNATY